MRFHGLPSSVAVVSDSPVPLACAPVLPPPPPPAPHVLPAATPSVATPEFNPKGGSAESLPKFLQWLNAVPTARDPDSAKSFHLFMNLTCVGDCPGLDFPRESLYSQWEYLTRNTVQHPTWGVQAFVVQQSMRPPPLEPPAVAAWAAVTTAQSQNQAARASASSSRATSRGGGADADRFPIAVYIRWTANQNVHRPCTSPKLSSVMRTVFGADHVAHVADQYLRQGTDGQNGGYSVVGISPAAERNHFAIPILS